MTDRPWRVAISSRDFELTPDPIRYLADHGCEIVRLTREGFWADSHILGDELVETLDGIDAIIGGPHLTPSVIARLTTLKHVSRRGLGYDMIAIDDATRAGLVVTITPHTTEDGVADHAFALMLAAARGIALADRRLRAGEWTAITGTELWRKTLGIVGMGRIGRKIARRARGFDMQVLAHDVYVPDGGVDADGVRYCGLDELLAESDIVSLSVNLNESTRHLIGPMELARMKPTATLINTSRGAVVDEEALYQALADGMIASAGIDTYEGERADGTRLIDLDNVVLTPHMGGHTVEGTARANMRAARNVIGVRDGWLDDENDVVNPAAWVSRIAREGIFADIAVAPKA